MGGPVGGSEAGCPITLRAVVPTCLAFLTVACGASRVPQSLRGYNVLVEEKDEQSVELARAMREQGIKVRPKVRGGSGHTAALIYFIFSDPGPGQPLWFHLRLADTRSGEIVGAATIPLDSLTATPRARARAAIKALAP